MLFDVSFIRYLPVSPAHSYPSFRSHQGHHLGRPGRRCVILATKLLKKFEIDKFYW